MELSRGKKGKGGEKRGGRGLRVGREGQGFKGTLITVNYASLFN